MRNATTLFPIFFSWEALLSHFPSNGKCFFPIILLLRKSSLFPFSPFYTEILSPCPFYFSFGKCLGNTSLFSNSPFFWEILLSFQILLLFVNISLFSNSHSFGKCFSLFSNSHSFGKCL